jgi:hypothetical protein
MSDPKKRIDLRTKTPEEKMYYVSKSKELGYPSLTAMIFDAINQLIDGSDESSPKVLRLQQELSMEKEQKMELEAKLWKTSNAYQYSQEEIKELRIETYGSVNGLNAVLMGRQIDHFIKMQNGVTRQDIISAIDPSGDAQGWIGFLSDYTDLLLEEGLIINMLDGKKEVLWWIKKTKN